MKTNHACRQSSGIQTPFKLQLARTDLYSSSERALPKFQLNKQQKESTLFSPVTLVSSGAVIVSLVGITKTFKCFDFLSAP